MQKVSRVVIALLIMALAAASLAQEAAGMADEGTVEVNGASIFYSSQGEGEPMVLIHGYPLSGELFRDNVGPLAASYRVITVDLRGFGRSEAPDDQASIETYATDVLAVMDELGIDEAIVGGMSMGGITIFEMVRQAPERLSGIVLIDTVHLPAATAEAAMWRGVAAQAEEEGVASLVDFLMPDMLSGNARMNREELVEHLSGLVEQASLEGAVGGANALADRADSTATLGDITVPTLIIVGLEDTLTPFEVHEEMQGAIEGSELVIIPGAAHASNFEAAEAANEAILEWANAIE
jgi:pimeloyl-ACP methyl ester carboxylesterase